MTEQQYIDYFEELAARHALIRHSSAEPRFYVVRDDNMTALEKAVRDRLRLPCVCLDQYVDTLDRTADNNRLVILGGLSVLVGCRPEDPADVQLARADARLMALQFMNRMVNDSYRRDTLLRQQNVVCSRTFEGEPVPIIAGTATGWAYPFSWSLPTVVADDPAIWL